MNDGEEFVTVEEFNAVVDELLEALIHTVEYVGVDTLPPLEGWSWFDALRKYRPKSAGEWTKAYERMSISDEESESNLVKHARRELELLGEEAATVEGYLRVIQAFADMGHSGGSASVAIPTINELLSFRNLTDLTDNPGEWFRHTPDMWDGENHIWQSLRRSEAFSTDGGKTYYLLSEGHRPLFDETLQYPIHISKTHIPSQESHDA